MASGRRTQLPQSTAMDLADQCAEELAGCRRRSNFSGDEARPAPRIPALPVHVAEAEDADLVLDLDVVQLPPVPQVPEHWAHT
jgi:hypothetical protein